MSAGDSVDTLFHSKKSLRVASLWQRDRDDTEGSIAPKGDSRSLRSRESPSNLNIKGISWTSVKTWITAGGPLVQVGSAPVRLVPSKKLDRPLGGCHCRYEVSPRDVSIPRGPASRSREETSSLSGRDMTSLARRFVEKRVRGGPWFQNSFRDRRLLVFMPNEKDAYSPRNGLLK